MTIIRIEFVVFAAGFALLLACAPVARREQATESLQLELELAGKPQGAAAFPDPVTVQEDTEQAIRRIQAQRRIDALIRETIERSRRRPDLNYDVFSGIQSRNLAHARR
ncbi:MAG: hypothetical protein ACE5JN_14620 [Candidatus Methylomirabilia bacterium]